MTLEEARLELKSMNDETNSTIPKLKKSEALEIAIDCVETCINEENRRKYQDPIDFITGGDD